MCNKTSEYIATKRDEEQLRVLLLSQARHRSPVGLYVGIVPRPRTVFLSGIKLYTSNASFCLATVRKRNHFKRFGALLFASGFAACKRQFDRSALGTPNTQKGLVKKTIRTAETVVRSASAIRRYRQRQYHTHTHRCKCPGYLRA